MLNSSLDRLLQDWHQQLSLWAQTGTITGASLDAFELEEEPKLLGELVQQWSRNEFGDLPPLVLLPGTAMPGAAGAYARSTGTIYLNQDWLVGTSSEQALAVLTEELGHHLDGLLNLSDTPGDEGALFAALLQRGGAISERERQALLAQNDRGRVLVAGRELEVEQAAIVRSSPLRVSFPGKTGGEVRNAFAFAALKSDGSVITWGLPSDGGDSSGVVSQLRSGVKQVFSSDFAFAALKSDGSVVTWGNTSFGGDSSAVANQLTNVDAFANPFTDDRLTSETPTPSGSIYSISRIDSSDGREGEKLQFRITRSGDISQAGSVRVATKSGGATADVDFRSLNTTIAFATGQATADVSVDALWDLETEGTETFSININTTSSRDRIGTASVSGLINNVQARYASVDKDGQPFVIKESSYNPITKRITHTRRSDPAWMVSFRGANEPFNFRRPTYVYIHGWKDDADSSNSKIIYEALSSRGANVINVDWSTMAAIDSIGQPTKAVTATQQVGETVADFLIKTGLPLPSATLIGHSLGSLVASSAAREIKSRMGQQIAELVALDTAFGVAYDIDGRTNRFDAPLSFNTGLAKTTTSFTASDLIGGIPTSAGDNDRAATADKAYLVQYARSRNLPWFSPDFV
jgi:pimeloyl-ACP methyl ester carboxylesterase